MPNDYMGGGDLFVSRFSRSESQQIRRKEQISPQLYKNRHAAIVCRILNLGIEPECRHLEGRGRLKRARPVGPGRQ